MNSAAKRKRRQRRALARTVRLVAWTYRDGSVHMEVKLASFHNDADEMVTHLDGGWWPSGYSKFKSMCGESYWGKGSATGLGDTGRVTCEECRAILSSIRLYAASPQRERAERAYERGVHVGG